MKIIALQWLASIVVGSQVLLAASPAIAASPNHVRLSGGVSIHFSISGNEHVSASVTDGYHIILAPDEFSGCAIKTIPLIHARELIVQILPRSLAKQLQGSVKLTITLTRSGKADPVQTPVLSMMWRGHTYVNLTGKPRTTISAGGLSGSFEIPQFRDVSTGQNQLTVKGSWHCSSLLHFTAK